MNKARPFFFNPLPLRVHDMATARKEAEVPLLLVRTPEGLRPQGIDKP